MPGYDFDSFQMRTIHDETMCLDGDIFTHAKTWRFTEMDKVERKNKHTEKDIQEGKVRQGDPYNAELEQDELDLNDQLEDDPQGLVDNLDSTEQYDHQDNEDNDLAFEDEENDLEVDLHEDL